MLITRRLFIILAVLALSAALMPGCGKKDPSAIRNIVVATDATWPPMEMMNEQKEIEGFDIDLIKAVAKEGGFTVEIVNMGWDGIFGGLAADKYDAVISSVTITPERRRTMDFSTPYLNAGQVLVVRADATGYTKLMDLAGRNVGTQIGTGGAFEVEKIKSINLKTYDEIGLAIEDLINKRLDGVVTDTPVAANYVLRNKNYRGKLKIVGKPFTSEFFAVAVKKGNRAVLEKVNAGLKAVMEKGLNKELEKKWLQ